MRASHHRYTYAEYRALERSTNTKHEFLDGEIFAMAGGTPEHAALQVEVTTQLRAQLNGKPCKVFSSDLRVRVEATGLSTYPDAAVICGEWRRDPQEPTCLTNPTVLVEVTSPSSEEYDHGLKYEHYRQIASLREYVVVSHREKLIEVFRRSEDGGWARFEAREGMAIQLESVGATLAVDVTYAGISLT